MAEINKKSKICSKKKERDKGYSWQKSKRFNVANWIAYLLISKYKHAIQLALSKNSYLNIFQLFDID